MRWWLGALALLALSVVLRLEYLVFALYVFLGLLALSRHWARRWTDWIEVERRGSRTEAEIGEHARIQVTLRNRGRGRIPWLLIEESLPQDALRQTPPRIRAGPGRITVVSLRPGESRVLSYEVEFLQRGYYPFGPLLLESGDLFGLHRRYRLASEPCFVLVRPKVVPLLGYDLASRRPIGEVRLRHRFFEDPTRIAGVRPYEKGDPLNRVHWRATARTGTLHSKVFEPSCVAGATLLLDFHRDGFLGRHRAELAAEVARQLAAVRATERAADFGGPEVAWVELAVTTVASLANAVYQQGQQIGFVSNGRDAADRLREEGWKGEFRSRQVAARRLTERPPNDRLQPVSVETRRGPEQLRRILDTLARLELTDGLSFADMVSEAIGRLPRDATVAAVLTRVPEETAVALGTLRRAGFSVTAVMVSFEETEYLDWASPPEWADRLLAEGIAFRRVRDEASLEQLCAGHFVR
jgi:uncharacterized protein (DUF58 family)